MKMKNFFQYYILKCITLFVAVGITLSFTACDNKSMEYEENNSITVDSSSQSTVNSIKLNMVTQYSAYSQDIQEIKVIISNSSEIDYYFEVYTFVLQKKINGKWEKVPFKEDGDNFPYLSGIIKPSSNYDLIIDLKKHINLPLSPGIYRIQKDALNAEFEIK